MTIRAALGMLGYSTKQWYWVAIGWPTSLAMNRSHARTVVGGLCPGLLDFKLISFCEIDELFDLGGGNHGDDCINQN